MKKERMIIAFLSLLFLLPGCKEEKTQSVFITIEQPKLIRNIRV